MANVTKFIY